MKVLLLISDLYKEVGGGQTVYRKIVESTPEVDFYYFSKDEPEFSIRPSNARALPLLTSVDVHFTTPPPHPEHFVQALRSANQYARSVAGRAFDIVEVPDWVDYGYFLRAAFKHHQVEVKRFVLALHGNISESIENAWGSPGDCIGEIGQLEALQFDGLDGAYGISKQYISKWQARVQRPVHYVDPAHFVNAGRPEPLHRSPERKPALLCIGRSERRKGNDLFVELVRWTNPALFSTAEHIGGTVGSGANRSDRILADLAHKREVSVGYRSAMSHDQLHQLFSTPSVVVLPVRRDSLNLVCLEALFSGCPVLISANAGVCSYLDERHPHLPYEKLDADNFYGGVAQLETLLENYDDYRENLLDQLTRHPPAPTSPLDMRTIYADILAQPVREPSLTFGPIASGGGSGVAEGPIPSTRGADTELLDDLEHRIASETLDVAGPMTGFLHDTQGLVDRLVRAGKEPERNADALDQKLGLLYYLTSGPILRCNFWSEIARVERLRGDAAMALAYELRLLRLLGSDRLNLVPRVCRSLQDRGNTAEVAAVEALYGPDGGEEAVYELLCRRRDSLRDYREKPLQISDDRRTCSQPKVSVIVSLYNAAAKLPLFLTMLCRQTLLRNGQVEVILVDSGSPADERSAFEACHRDLPFDALYVRSAERETIQSAWNRGIKLARAPYLVFLGVDEALYPEALAMLADELENNPDVDWVMANSLVTEVEETGLFKNDVMTYDRDGGTKDHLVLETCYISWVGGMYRASIHDRFGYYDEEFRGAGDTEFKNRIFPQLTVKYVDRLLGLFLNYPEGQTTASPMAEIEDTRAWYLFRTPGGIRYLFEQRPIEEVEATLALCLGYRKSYCRHISSDVEFAVPLARYILSRKPHSTLARLVLPDLERMREAIRALEFAENMPTNAGVRARILDAWRNATLAQERHRVGLAALGYENVPVYDILNDNRYEQHSWLWQSKFERR